MLERRVSPNRIKFFKFVSHRIKFYIFSSISFINCFFLILCIVYLLNPLLLLNPLHSLSINIFFITNIIIIWSFFLVKLACITRFRLQTSKISKTHKWHLRMRDFVFKHRRPVINRSYLFLLPTKQKHFHPRRFTSNNSNCFSLYCLALKFSVRVSGIFVMVESSVVTMDVFQTAFNSISTPRIHIIFYRKKITT